MYMLGVLLQDHKLTKVLQNYITLVPYLMVIPQRALTAFYGIGPALATKICARLQIHDRSKIRQLTPTQITGIASFLSSPLTSPQIPWNPLARPDYVPPGPGTPMSQIKTSVVEAAKAKAKAASTSATIVGAPDPNATTLALKKLLKSDPLRGIKVESELKREMKENIARQRLIGSYVGKRHAMQLPVRGQNTQSNAKTARKLNRVDRFG